MRRIFIVFALLLATGSIHAQAPLTHNAMTERLGACISCHGEDGRTINTEYLPRIAGKPARYLFNQLMNFRDGRRNIAAMSHLLQPLSGAYLSAQFGAWRAGQHRAHAPDCMAGAAKALSPADVSAVAAWLSMQPVTSPAKPIAKLDAPMPLKCGGVPQ